MRERSVTLPDAAIRAKAPKLVSNAMNAPRSALKYGSVRRATSAAM